MRICIPTDDPHGLQGRIATHFGRAPYYTLIDGDPGGSASVVRNEHASHEHGQCSLPDRVAGSGVGAVICRGIGRSALARLRERGIEIFLTDAVRVEEGVAAYRSGRLTAMTSVEACHGGDHEAH